jgi:light-regulated signal transduction histidine kinase (bacteriophytochrome)
VLGRSCAWKPHQTAAAAQLGQAIRTLHRAERLTRSNQALLRGNEELETFAYTAAHDLKEPLRGIGRYSERIKQNLADSLPDDEQTRLDAILRLTRRMDGLIDSLLHYSRLGKAQLSLQSVDLGQIVKDALDSLRPGLDQANTVITVKSEFPILICDPVRIHEVFVNLIANAVKYNDSPLKQIEIGAFADAEWVFYVKDNGIGIAPEFHDTVFGIFRRLHGREAYGGGTGVGLAIAKKVVELHGGKIWLESSPGAGSVFYFSLPSAKTGVPPAIC